MLELYINSFSEPNKNSKASTNLDEAKNFLQDVDGVNYRNVLTKSVSLKEKRAIEFLTTNPSAYDMNLALIICQLHNFRVSRFVLFNWYAFKLFKFFLLGILAGYVVFV